MKDRERLLAPSVSRGAVRVAWDELIRPQDDSGELPDGAVELGGWGRFGSV